MGLTALQPSNQIASRIHPHRHADTTHPFRQLITTGNVGITETTSANAAIRLLPDGGHAIQGLDQPLPVGRQCRLTDPGDN